MVARDKMTGPSAALTAKSASSHSSEGTYAAKWSAPVSAGGKTDPCPHTRGRSITWDVWRTQRAFALQFGIGLRDIESWRGYLGARENCGARNGTYATVEGAAAASPAFHPGARPRLGGWTVHRATPLRASTHEVTEFEFHISPVSNSSRPQTGVGMDGRR